MRAASRESFAVAKDRLTAMLGRQAQAEELASDLRSVAALLLAQPALRRALVDPGRSARLRVDLLEQLLASRVSSASMTLLSSVVHSRWSSSTDLVDAIELLSIEAEFTVARDAQVLQEVEDELFRFGRIVAGDPRLAAAVGDRSVSAERRAALVSSLVARKVHPCTRRLIEFVLTGLGGRPVDASIDRLVELAAEHRGREIAYVRVASPLTDEQQRRLADRLADEYGRPISVRMDVDPSLLGGAVIRIGDEVYDGSVARHLSQARSTLGRS